MEDLVPLLIFIVIAVINLLKYQAEKKGKSRPPPAPEEERPQQQPTSLEEFFEEIARKFEPKPTPQPEWPENVERPDYMQEMEEFEQTQANLFEEEEPVRRAVPIPPEKSAAPVMPREMAKAAVVELQTTRSLETFKLPVQGDVFAGLGGMRIATPRLLRSAAGKTAFELKRGQSLKQAIIAGFVFGPPRAFDSSFDNTIAK
jgi:hypothetical protein